ncbi:GNAT family N-acetyltransferase [Natronorubrum daqingense]|uniref:GNAT family N-acetyltransferase n=1 Tax=Natronorubrum daqingense TaxID=588898 RepID=A0A1N6Z7M2_9EURY|nr:GNAT family N-acetyltransferase [Natronorubrum daqingense]APX95432.1 GNAT family N-acetyltransferase [Natronorubrum daqingense]SIR22860.1 L-amino acid N-acyltransferase YncA [Natronorubrum daqingense]
MEIREATDDDIEAIRSIAQRSLKSTYTDFLEQDTVDDAVEQWYGDSFSDQIDDDHSLVLVIERDGDVIGFSQNDLIGQRYRTGRILWLHIDPDTRGSGTGVRLLVRTRELLLEEGAEQIQCLVLADNEGGNEFYTSHGFEQAGQREVDIGEETFTENVYVESEIGDEGWGAVDELEVDGEQIYVSYGEAARGAEAPFYRTYETEDREELYAWFCGNCDSIDNTMDTMGRIECNVCGNRRKATRWDASYL